MTDIKEGDRVRATSKRNDDTAEFTVFSVSRYSVTSATNHFDAEDFNFEVIKRAENPVPTEPGIYSFYEEDTSVLQYRRLLLTNKGEWYFLDFTGTSRDDVLDPVPDIKKVVNGPVIGTKKHAVTLVYKGKTN